jgi:hypothetical protein
MERYVWASVLYYAVAVVASVLVVAGFIANLGVLWSMLALLGYAALMISLNAWRRRRHPRSVYQVELAKRDAGFSDS